ncbi:MAG: MBL fold metallo-hydrolase [Thermoplasmata archaeon]|nr:MBL fold metallo-hydrolase [Thermoplasmata archaeon]MBE3142086.1 MBL fold metallo-hydrolase [Thermoplasmata archaeon]
MNSSMKCQFLGGSDEVGNLAMVLELEDMRFLFDYGMSPGKPPTFPLPPPPIDLTFLTHSHLDHCGMIPWLCSQSDHRIIATEPTAVVSNLLQKDTVKIAQMDGYSIPFTSADVKEAEHSYVPVEPGKMRDLGENYSVRFHSAGHIPGSLMFELVGEKRLLFTGDLNVVDTRLVRGTKPVPCDMLFMEGTYAGREHENRQQIERAFLEKIEEVVNRGGTVIIPAFAVARSQELLLVLKNVGYDVWFDGMGKKISKLYLKYPKYLRSVDDLKKAFKKVNVVHSEHGRKMAMKGPVIITSSGMMDGGPVLSYMNKLKNDRKSAVLLTGYQVEGTNSRLLIEKGRLNFYGVVEKVDCEVQYYDFSAHAGHSELVEFAKQCKPEKIILFHSADRAPLVESLKDTAEVLTPMKGERFSL